MTKEKGSTRDARKQVFDCLTGGTVPDDLPLPLGIAVNPLRDQIKGISRELRERRPAMFQDIYIDIVDDLRLNALAFKDETGEYIGVNIGFALFLPHIINHLVAQPQLFLNIGDTSKERPTVVQIDDRTLSRKGRVSNLDVQDLSWVYSFDHPLDEVRQRFGGFLTISAQGFLLYHEIGHLVRCHLDFLRQSGFSEDDNLNVFLEFENDVPEEQLHIRRILEFDADMIAAQNMLDAIIHNGTLKAARAIFGSDAPELRNWGWPDLCYIMHIAIGVIFEIMACLDGVKIEEPSRTHPHPDVRRNLILNLSWRTWKQYIPDQSKFIEVCKRAQRDFLEIIRLKILPSSRARYFKSYHDAEKEETQLIWNGVCEINKILESLISRRQAGFL